MCPRNSGLPAPVRPSTHRRSDHRSGRRSAVGHTGRLAARLGPVVHRSVVHPAGHPAGLVLAALVPAALVPAALVLAGPDPAGLAGPDPAGPAGPDLAGPAVLVGLAALVGPVALAGPAGHAGTPPAAAASAAAVALAAPAPAPPPCRPDRAVPGYPAPWLAGRPANGRADRRVPASC